MYRGIVDDLERVRSLNGLEEAVTAILVRDQSNLNRFQEFCERRDIGGIVLVGQEHHSDSRTLLARIPDVKGLEYDAVIVMGVNDSFSGTFFNKKLLYLATTIAKLPALLVGEAVGDTAVHLRPCDQVSALAARPRNTVGECLGV